MSWKFNPFTNALDYYKDRYDIVNHSSDVVLTIEDLKKVHTMDVSGGVRTITLPNVGADDIGLWVILVRIGTTNGLQIWATGGDVILNSSVGGYIQCADAGHDYSNLELIVMGNGQWGIPSFGIWESY